MSKKQSFFWPSYSDLMTSLFFVMLVLFVITIGALVKSAQVTREKLQAIEEIQDALEGIDPRYFSYNETYKKHVLDIGDKFDVGSADIADLNAQTRESLKIARNSLLETMNKIQRRYRGVRYLIVIEGQASRDDYVGNDILSYRRAIALRDFWFGNDDNHADLNNIIPNCEIIIAGSGQYGVPRDKPDTPPANQRFLVSIVPKVGDLDF